MTARIGGRPRQIDRDDIVREGRALGLHNLTVSAVAGRLGVSTTALYRHVDSRWELERLVGEDILAGLVLTDDPAHGPAQHLLSVCLQLRAFILAHHGLARYVQTLFPRGASGRRLLATETRALASRGYAQDAALVLCTAAASLAIGLTAYEEVQRERAEGLDEERLSAEEALATDPQLAAAFRALPTVDPEEYAGMWLGCMVRAFVDAAPPGRPVDQIRAALNAAVEGV